MPVIFTKKLKMADGGIQRSTFIVKHDGSIDFWINQKSSVQEISVFHFGILDLWTPNSKNQLISPLQTILLI